MVATGKEWMEDTTEQRMMSHPQLTFLEGFALKHDTTMHVYDYPCNVDCKNRVKRATLLKMFCQQYSDQRKCGKIASFRPRHIKL